MPTHRYHSRRSIRLKGYNYSWPGWYYVTMCTKDRHRSLGEILRDRLQPSAAGKIIEQTWTELPGHFPGVELDAYVIMPDHMHGILIMNNEPRQGGQGGQGQGLINQTLTEGEGKDKWILMKNPDLTLGKIMRHFKAKSTKLIHDAGFTGFGWQRNYYEHIIRNDHDLHRIRRYIANNPLRWALKEQNRGKTKVHMTASGISQLR